MDNMELRAIRREDPLFNDVKNLYEASFPENERRPVGELLEGFRGEGELLAALDEGVFVGLVSLLSCEDITHILYFAVRDELRNQGYGSRILTLIRTRYPGQRIIVDVERPEDGIPNRAQREERIAFYRKNGYADTRITYRWEGEDYRIMSSGGDVTKREFRRFWEHFRPDNDGTRRM